MVRIILLLIVCVLSWACSEIPATNPFDPETPRAQQVEGSIRGSLILVAPRPATCAEPGDDGRCGCTLGELDDMCKVSVETIAVEVLLKDATTNRIVDRITPSNAEDQASGAFLFEEAVAGQYEVEFIAPGFRLVACPEGRLECEFSVNAAQIELNLGYGQHFEFPEPGVVIPRIPADEEEIDRTTWLTGRVLLSGVEEESDEHGGSIVEQINNPEVVRTASNGTFRLRMLPGDSILRIEHSGYTPHTEALGVVVEGQERALEDIVLQGNPGEVTGGVRLLGYETAARLQAVDVSLEGNGSENLRNPDAAGRFVIPQVAAGTYELVVTSQGYDPVRLPVVMAVGETIRLGSVLLSHKSRGADRTIFTGRIRVGDTDNHAGTVVHVRFAETGESFASVLTGGDGTFAVAVAPDERYAVLIEREGYETPSSESLGVFSATEAGVTNENGDELDETLSRPPLNGSITVDVTIGPDWIPEPQQFVRITIKGLNKLYQNIVEGVTENTPLTFDNLEAGRYQITAERPGFETVLSEVSVDNEMPDVGARLSIRLRHLADAQIDFEGQSLDACELRTMAVNFRGADLSGANMQGNFGGIEPGRCDACQRVRTCGPFDFTRVNFTNTSFSTRQRANLEGVRLSEARFLGADLTAVNLRGASLERANLFGVVAPEADFSGALLESANFTSGNLEGALFSAPTRDERHRDGPWVGRLMADDNVLAAQTCSAEATRTAANLVGSTFAQANLEGAFMVGTDLRRTILNGARLVGADLRKACLQNASLTQIDLTDATLDGADAQDAILTSSIMNETGVRGVNLTDASLTDAVIELADFGLFPAEGRNAGCEARTLRRALGLDADEPITAAFAPIGACGGRDGDVAPQCRCVTRLTGANLNGSNLVGTQLVDTDLTNASLLGVTFGVARTDDGEVQTSLSGSRLSGAEMTAATLNDVELESSILAGANLRNSTILGAAADGVDWPATVFISSDIEELRLSNANLTDTHFEHSLITYSSFDDSMLNAANFTDTDLQNVSFAGSRANVGEVACTDSCGSRGRPGSWAGDGECDDGGIGSDQALCVVGTDCRDCGPRPLVDQECDPMAYEEPNAAIVRIPSSTFRNVCFSGVQWCGADLRQAEIRFNDDIACPDLDPDNNQLAVGAYLKGVNLSGSDIRGMDMADSNFDGADFTQTQLTGVDLAHSSFMGTNFENSQWHNGTEGGLDGPPARNGELYVDISESDFSGAVFINSLLRHIAFRLSGFDDATFRGAVLEDVRFGFVESDVVMNNVNFDSAQILNAHWLRSLECEGCTFRHTVFENVAISSGSLRIIGPGNLFVPVMHTTRFLGGQMQIVAEGQNAPYVKFTDGFKFNPGSSFRNSKLHNADFRGACGLDNVDFSGTDFGPQQLPVGGNRTQFCQHNLASLQGNPAIESPGGHPLIDVSTAVDSFECLRALLGGCN